MNCWNCQARSVFTGDAKVVKCGECDSLNGIPGVHPASNQEDKVFFLLQNLSKNLFSKAQYLKCRECNVHLKTYEGVLVVSCPRCKTLNRLP